jgi:hypothetical protein
LSGRPQPRLAPRPPPSASHNRLPDLKADLSVPHTSPGLCQLMTTLLSGGRNAGAPRGPRGCDAHQHGGCSCGCSCTASKSRERASGCRDLSRDASRCAPPRSSQAHALLRLSKPETLAEHMAPPPTPRCVHGAYGRKCVCGRKRTAACVAMRHTTLQRDARRRDVQTTTALLRALQRVCRSLA